MNFESKKKKKKNVQAGTKVKVHSPEEEQRVDNTEEKTRQGEDQGTLELQVAQSRLKGMRHEPDPAQEDLNGTLSRVSANRQTLIPNSMPDLRRWINFPIVECLRASSSPSEAIEFSPDCKLLGDTSQLGSHGFPGTSQRGVAW